MYYLVKNYVVGFYFSLKSKAITLVELLVAVSIFSFIIASSYLLFRGFNRAYQRGVNESMYVGKLRLISRVFSKDISSMYKNCVGTENSLAFLSLRVRGDEFYVSEVHYWINSDKIYRSVEKNSDFNFITTGTNEILVDNVDKARFYYYDGHDWLSKWAKQGLPNEVKLKVKWLGKNRTNEFHFKVMGI